LRDGTPDGTLVVVSADGARCLPTETSLIAALADWARAEGRRCARSPSAWRLGTASRWMPPRLAPPCRDRGNGSTLQSLPNHVDLMQIAPICRRSY